MPPSPNNSLFKMGICKRKTSSTSAAELQAAADQRLEADKRDLAKQFNDVPVASAPSVSGKKKLSMNPDAVRKRNAYQKKKKKQQKEKARQQKAATDAEESESRQQPPEADAEAEAETHYLDDRGRKRKRKQLRTRAADAATVTAGGIRMFTDSEKQLIVEATENEKKRTIGNVNFATVAKSLAEQHPAMFGSGAPTGAITRQAVRCVVKRHEKGTIEDRRGRPSALPQAVVLTIMAALTSVVSARATIMSAPMLQPIVLGVVIASGCASLINEGRKKRGKFCCGLDFVRGLMKDRGWRNVRPQGDTRKLPTGWAALRAQMVLRLAYFVFVHEIPRDLVINADHTGIMFTQVKGRMWITKEQAEAKDKSVKGHGDKRQFTLLATTSASGETLPHQVVVEGKTSKALPDFGQKYKTSLDELNSKGFRAVCFVLLTTVASVCNIASFCCTSNHWSDNVTSRAYVKDVAVPYFRRKILALRADDPKACKPYGEQVCVLIVDCWWGWLDAAFKEWMKSKYPWIRLVFVPAACTPVAQPMDAGIIAKLKGKLRTLYGSWVCNLTQQQLRGGTKPEDIKVPADVPTCKKNLFEWLSLGVAQLNEDKAGIVHCWEKTDLLKAWDRATQVEASGKVKELFKNIDEVTINLANVHDTGTEDEEAGDLGVPFTQKEHDDEWIEWINWDEIEAQTGGGGSSSAS